MSTLASCASGFGWMTNSEGQDPCTIAAWLIELCQDSSSSTPANLQPLSTSYSSPNGTSATACSCSWATYNNIEACTICQNGQPKSYSDWTSNCDLLGLSSSSSYWTSSTSFSSKTKLPAWSIFNPTKWSSGTFNANEAQSLNDEGRPDVTDSSASQPSASFTAASSSSGNSNKSPIGAIVGGVIGGIAALLVIAFIAWFILRRRRRHDSGRPSRRRRQKEEQEKRFDLTEEGQPLPSPTTHTQPLSFAGVGSGAHGGGNLLPAQLHMHNQQSIYPYPQQVQMQPNLNNQAISSIYPVSAATRRPSHDTTRSDNTNIVTNVERLRSSNENIPSVAEQLDEKRRLRAAGRGIGESQAPSSFFNPALTHSRQGSSSNPSEDGTGSDVQANSNTVSISHASNRFFANRHNTGSASIGGSGLSSPTSAGQEDISPTSNRRNSLLKTWRRRRMHRVMNPGSDSHILIESTALPLGSTVAAEGQTTTPGEVVAQIPGARVPNARDRENPPPEYANT